MASMIADGDALYKWVMQVVHKRRPATTYHLRFIDAHSAQQRGCGTLTCPDTTGSDDFPAPAPAPPAPPPPAYPSPYGQPTPPPGYPGMPYPWGSPPPAQQQPPPAPVPAPSASSSEEIAALRIQNAQLLNELATARAREGFLSGRIVERDAAPAPMPASPPPPAAPPPPVAAAPAPAPEPPRKPADGAPPGFTHVPGFGYVASELMASVLMNHLRSTIAPPPAPAPHPAPAAPPPAPAPPLTPPTGLGLPPLGPPPTLTSTIAQATKNMEEAASGIASMYSAAEKVRQMFSKRERDDEEDDPPPAAAATQPNGDPAKKPFEILEAGPVRVPYNPETGNISGIMHMAMVNGDKITDWVGRVIEKASSAAAAAQASAAGRGPLSPPPTLPPPPTQNNWPPPPPMPKG
jgi:hypothetical protein